jgi:hypothetical protein
MDTKCQIVEHECVQISFEHTPACLRWTQVGVQCQLWIKPLLFCLFSSGGDAVRESKLTGLRDEARMR